MSLLNWIFFQHKSNSNWENSSLANSKFQTREFKIKCREIGMSPGSSPYSLLYCNSTTKPYSFPIIDLATQYRRQHAANCIPHVLLPVTKSLISLTVMRFSSESCSLKMANWRTLRKLLPISNSSLPQNVRNLK